MYKKMKLLSERDYWQIKRYSRSAFESIGSENYRQRLVYKLLNTARVNNQSDFFSFLLRTSTPGRGMKTSGNCAESLNGSTLSALKILRRSLTQ